MKKVHILDTCEYCEGEAYVCASEYPEPEGQTPRYLPCPQCHGSGEADSGKLGNEAERFYRDVVFRRGTRALVGCYEEILGDGGAFTSVIISPFCYLEIQSQYSSQHPELPYAP